MNRQATLTPDAIQSKKDTVSAEEWQLRVDLAAAYRLIALHGWDDLIFTHLSARIPNYRLRECHEQNRALFESVTRLTLKDVPHSMRYIIWDENNATLMTPEQFEARNAAAAVTEAAQAA